MDGRFRRNDITPRKKAIKDPSSHDFQLARILVPPEIYTRKLRRRLRGRRPPLKIPRDEKGNDPLHVPALPLQSEGAKRRKLLRPTIPGDVMPDSTAQPVGVRARRESVGLSNDIDTVVSPLRPNPSLASAPVGGQRGWTLP